MADNDRNYKGDNDTSNQEWNENSRQKSDWENRGSRNYKSQDNNNGGSGYGHSHRNESNRWNQGSNYNQGNDSRFGQDQDRNYGGREYGSSYGGGLYQGNNSYYESGSSKNERPSSGSSRNLYDRDYEGFNRGSNSGNSGVGASNYGGYDRRREGFNHDRDRGYNSNFNGGNYYGSGRSNYGQGDNNERSWWDRTRDEVSSWFGDPEAERRREHDSELNHKGKGPRNYSRSDDRIKDDINDRLSDDPWVDASEIEITVSSGEVTITGTVGQRAEKRRAEDLAEAVSGVKHVENRVRVGKRDESKVGTGSSIGNSSAGTSTYGSDSSAVPSASAGATSGSRSK